MKPNPADTRELLALATGHMAARAIQTATLLGFFDQLSDRPASAEALAAATDTDAGAALRLLRTLVSLGLVAESAEGGFSAAPAAVPLRKDADASIRHLVLMFGSERSWRSWGHLAWGVRTGQTASVDLYGMNGFEYHAANPGPAANFHAAMAEVSRATSKGLVESYDFSRYRSIADIGGGNGALIARVLAAAPQARGLLLELAGALPEASARLNDAGVADRCDIVEGDFFTAIPSGFDLYLLKNVLHDWDDANCARILARLRAAMDAESTALIVERVLEDRTEATPAYCSMVLMDLNMMVTSGGRERTRRQFEDMVESAGLEMTRPPVRMRGFSPYSLVEVRLKRFPRSKEVS